MADKKHKKLRVKATVMARGECPDQCKGRVSTKAKGQRTHSFRFVDDSLNRKLVALLKKRARGKYVVDIPLM